ncbi:UPF0407 protein C2orf39 protein [Fasciola gigantica]|uniref:UPF0407 protein C2orf39 protein n=1 Tax=Fasciola gigantica TaxID=46835 RepID=A0A504Z087_FASGI|nr:UPF0407 protein C2orf39 protein [Fasciola gigantica]
MGLVKRSSMGTPRAMEYTTDALDSTKQPLWGVDSSHKDPDPKHTSVSEVTEITILPMDDDQTQQKCWSLIAPVNVVAALHQFTVEMQRLRSRCPGRTRSRPDGASEMDQSRRLRSDSKYSANDSKSMISSTNAGPPAVEPDKRDDTHDESYWNKYAYQIVSEETEKVWDHLYCALERYLAILKNRSQVIRETEALRRQNEELRHLLQQYLSAKVNYELQIPPVKTLQLE